MIQEPKYKWEVATAGLLHDIGKLYQKSKTHKLYRKDSAEHPLIAKDFIELHKKVFEQVYTHDEIEFITECTVRHHEGSWALSETNANNADERYKKYCKIISEADNISSSERDEEYKGNSTKIHKEYATLETPFNRISNGEIDLNRLLQQIDVYKVTKFSDANSHSTYQVGRQHKDERVVDDFINQFDKEVDAIVAKSKQDLFNKLSNIILEYAWCFPSSATMVIRDVSLYQHLITTSAIASAIYNDVLACTENDEFTQTSVKSKWKELIVATIKLVGAEKYILKQSKYGLDAIDLVHAKNYSITTEIESITLDIINRLQLTQANILIRNKGFDKLILLSSSFKDELNLAIKDINMKLYNRYKGELYLSYTLSNLDFSINEQTKFKQMRSLYSSATSVYIDGLQQLLQRDGKWDTQLFVINNKSKFRCIHCGRSLASESKICENCNYELNMVKQNSDTADFEYFKENIQKNTNRMSVIVVDGDKILDTMINGFRKEGEDYSTVSRVATYSSTLSNFFDSYIEEQLGDNVYVLHINANKVIVLCNSDNAAETALDINQLFSNYTSGKLNLSMTVKNININSRLNDIMNNYEYEIDSIKACGGNALKYCGLNLDFEDLSTFITIKELLTSDIENGCDKSVLKLLQTYSKMYEEYTKTKDVSKLMIVPYMEKNMRKMQSTSKETQKVIVNAFKTIFTEPNKLCKELYMIGIIAYEVELRTKYGGK